MLQALLQLLLCAVGVTAAGAARTLLDGAAGMQASIVNGQNAPRGRYPYFASLRTLDEPEFPFCGGSLITPTIVLTAAHCVLDTDTMQLDYQPSKLIVRINATARNSSATPDLGFEERRVAQIVWHPRFTVGMDLNILDYYNNDAALLLLDRPSTIPPVKLAPARLKPANPLPDFTRLTVIGMGRIQFDPRKYTPYLQQVALELLPVSTCQSVLTGAPYYGNYNFSTNSMICLRRAPSTGGAQTGSECSGDSGGPLLLLGRTAAEDEQVGIVSWSYKDPAEVACRTVPGVSTDIADEPWISQAVSALSSPMPASAAGAARGYPLVQGFNSMQLWTAQPAASQLSILSAGGFKYVATLQTDPLPDKNGSVLTRLLFTRRDRVEAAISSKGGLAVYVNGRRVAEGAGASLRQGQLRFAQQQPGASLQVTFSQPGLSIIIAQPFSKSRNAYMPWLNTWVTLTQLPTTKAAFEHILTNFNLP